MKVGSRVKFISDTGVGIIRSIQGNLAQVEVEGGFEIPALLSDLVEVPIEQENEAIVRIGPSDPKPSRTVSRPAAGTGENAEKKQRATLTGGIRNYGRVNLLDDYEDDEPIYFQKVRRDVSADNTPEETVAEPEKAPWEETDYLVKLLFVPVSGERPAEESDLDAYLVNDSTYTLSFSIAKRDRRGNIVRTLESGTLEADSKLHLKTYKRAELAEIITLHISLLPYKPTAYVPRAVESFDLELHPLKFVKAGNYKENDYFDLPALEFLLASADETAE